MKPIIAVIGLTALTLCIVPGRAEAAIFGNCGPDRRCGRALAGGEHPLPALSRAPFAKPLALRRRLRAARRRGHHRGARPLALCHPRRRKSSRRHRRLCPVAHDRQRRTHNDPLRHHWDRSQGPAPQPVPGPRPAAVCRPVKGPAPRPVPGPRPAAVGKPVIGRPAAADLQARIALVQDRRSNNRRAGLPRPQPGNRSSNQARTRRSPGSSLPKQEPGVRRVLHVPSKNPAFAGFFADHGRPSAGLRPGERGGPSDRPAGARRYRRPSSSSSSRRRS